MNIHARALVFAEDFKIADSRTGKLDVVTPNYTTTVFSARRFI